MTNNFLSGQNQKILALQNQVKSLQRENQNIEDTLMKQEKYVNLLKSKIEKLEKQLIKKNEEIMKKEYENSELNEKINELKDKIKNLKEMNKIEEKNEIKKLKEQIRKLTNLLEIKEQKITMDSNRFSNLQMKYFKMIKDKKKLELDNMMGISSNINKGLKSNTEIKLRGLSQRVGANITNSKNNVTGSTFEDLTFTNNNTHTNRGDAIGGNDKSLPLIKSHGNINLMKKVKSDKAKRNNNDFITGTQQTD